MTYSEFAEQLRKLKIDFRNYMKRDLQSVDELEKFLDRKLSQPKPRASRAARSLKGMF